MINKCIFSPRFIPAMAGSLLVPLCYLLIQELGLCAWTGALAGFMIIFGKSCSHFKT